MENSTTLVTTAPPPIPVGCICAYTWHLAHDGRIVRNGPLDTCPADHSAVDEAASETGRRSPAVTTTVSDLA